jgi:uncharacterized protein YndB with AHSA1/START domain
MIRIESFSARSILQLITTITTHMDTTQDWYVENEIDIACTPEHMWQVLVDPKYTRQYMFGCETVSSWQPGDLLDWRGEYQGQTMTFVTGIIKQIDPFQLLEYTTFDPNSAMENIPQNHVNVVYALTPIAGGVNLRVRQGNFYGVAEGERRYEEVRNNGLGWQPLLEEIKKVAESGS